MHMTWEIDRPVRSITTKLLLIDITRKKLDVTATAFNVLLKPNRILHHQGSVLVTKLRYLCRYGEMLGVIICLKTCKKKEVVASS